MNLRSVSTVALLAALFVPAHAQSSSSDEEANLSLTLPTDEWYVPKNTITFGYRFLNKGAKVNFGGLGNISMRTNTAPTTAGETRNYDNGSLTLDSKRVIETKTTPPTPEAGNSDTYAVMDGNGRYQVYLVNNNNGTMVTTQIGDYLAYKEGETRLWSYVSNSQINNGYVAMSNYGTTSEGATARHEEGMNGGVELSLARAMGKVGNRFEWSLTAGVALNNISSKTGGSVLATLNTSTDYYALNGPTPTTNNANGRPGGPTYADYTNSDGTVFTGSRETTTTINGTPNSAMHQTSSLAGGATVQGAWKIKGAYLLMRVGPSIRTQLTERFGLSASVGLAGAYAGSRYSVTETLELADVLEPVTESVDSATSKFLTGFYADMNLDWAANERTGLFAGVNMQNLGGYDQSVSGRTAKIDFGTALGIRGGLSYKF